MAYLNIYYRVYEFLLAPYCHLECSFAGQSHELHILEFRTLILNFIIREINLCLFWDNKMSFCISSFNMTYDKLEIKGVHAIDVALLIDVLTVVFIE